MVLGLIEKAILWFNRLIQWTFSVVLLGITGSLVTEFWQARWKTPPEVSLPCIMSAFSICITFFSIVTLYCLGRVLLHIAAALDFIIFVCYLASCILNRKNYHADGKMNDLYIKLTSIREAAGIDPHETKLSGLIKGMVGILTLMTVLYFITTLLSFALAQRADEKKYGKREHDYRSPSHHRRSRQHSTSRRY